MIKNPILREVIDWGLHILIAVAIALLIVTFVAQVTVVNGSSMVPTLQEGDRLLIEKISPKLGNLKHGDIVIVNDPEGINPETTPIIKRIIGLEGDTIEIKDGKVYRNGDPLVENYTGGDETMAENSQFSKVEVQKGQVYVMGDNREASSDSRMIGPQDIKKVSGKVILRIYPFSEFGTIKK